MSRPNDNKNLSLIFDTYYINALTLQLKGSKIKYNHSPPKRDNLKDLITILLLKIGGTKLIVIKIIANKVFTLALCSR